MFQLYSNLPVDFDNITNAAAAAAPAGAAAAAAAATTAVCNALTRRFAGADEHATACPGHKNMCPNQQQHYTASAAEHAGGLDGITRGTLG